MALTCTDCGTRIELPTEERRRLAGKFFACPECGASRKLPPAPTESAQEIFTAIARDHSPIECRLKGRSQVPQAADLVDELPNLAPENDWVTRDEIIAEAHQPLWRRLHWTKRGMVIVTSSLPLLWIVLSAIFASNTFDRGDHQSNGRSIFQGRGITTEEARSISLSQGMIAGAVTSAVIYFVLMFVLLALWFATTPDSSARAG